MKNLVRKFIGHNGEKNLENLSMAHNIILKSAEKTTFNFSDDLKEFLLEGHIIKNYNNLEISDNRIILPTEIADYFINGTDDISVLKNLKIINTDSNSIVIPLRKNHKNNCVWHIQGKEINHNNEDGFINKLVNLNTVSTCPIVSRDFLFKNQNFVHWLMATIQNDIYNEVSLSLFNDKEQIRSPSVESIFNVSKKRIKIINKGEDNSIILGLKEAINNVPGMYREKSKFFISRQFFNSLMDQLLDFNHPFSKLVFNNNKIMGYDYEIVEQMESNSCIFGNLNQGYTLIIKNDHYLERDTVTKKNFVQFFSANSFGGAIINENSIFILKILEE
jgi:HK97 family phage major capsid protein